MFAIFPRAPCLFDGSSTLGAHWRSLCSWRGFVGVCARVSTVSVVDTDKSSWARVNSNIRMKCSAVVIATIYLTSSLPTLSLPPCGVLFIFLRVSVCFCVNGKHWKRTVDWEFSIKIVLEMRSCFPQIFPKCYVSVLSLQ